MAGKEARMKTSKAKKWIGLAVDVLAIVLIIGLVVWNYQKSRPGPGEPPAENAIVPASPAAVPETAIGDVDGGPLLPPVPESPSPGSSRLTGIAVCALDHEPIRRGTILLQEGGEGEGTAVASLDSKGRFAFDWRGTGTKLSLGLAHEEYESPGWVEVSLEGGESVGETGRGVVRDLGAVAFEIGGRAISVKTGSFWTDPASEEAGEISDPVLLRFQAFACAPGVLDRSWGIPKSPASILPGTARENLVRMASEGGIKFSGEVRITTDGRTQQSAAMEQKVYIEDAEMSARDRGVSWSPLAGILYAGMIFQARALAREGGVEILVVEGIRSFHLGTYGMTAETKDGTGGAEVRWEEPVTLLAWVGPLREPFFLEDGQALLLDMVLESAPARGTGHIRAHAIGVEESYVPASAEPDDPTRLEHHVLITVEMPAEPPVGAPSSAAEEMKGTDS
jgi:hypothetical protein